MKLFKKHTTHNESYCDELKKELDETKKQLELYKEITGMVCGDLIDLSKPGVKELLFDNLNKSLAEKCVKQEEEIIYLKKRISYLEYLE